MCSHVMGVLLNEVFLIGSMDIVIMFDSNDICLLTLTISIGVNCRSCSYFCFLCFKC